MTRPPDDQGEPGTGREAALLAKIDDLTASLDAIRTGGIDAVMIPGPHGESLYTLTSADRPYRVLVEEMGEGAATLSEDRIVLYANQRFADLLKADRASLLGQLLTSLVQAHDAPRLADLLATAPGTTARHELTLVHPDGQKTPVLVSATGLDLDGTIVRCLIVTDLTRVAAIQQLEQAAQYARSLLEAALDPMVTINREGAITDVNQATVRATGVAREKLVGTSFSDYFTDPDEVNAVCWEVFDKGSATDYPLTLRHANEQVPLIDVLLNTSVYRDTHGEVLGAFAAARDVTKQLEAQRQIARQQAKDLDRLEQLERFQRLTVGRELKMIQLKKEIEYLRRYASHDGDDRAPGSE